jgi:hypothetical protein
VLAASLTSVALACSGALVADARAATTSHLTVRAVGTGGSVVTGPDQLAVSGSTAEVAVARVSGGNATVVKGPDSALPKAVKFPSYVGSGTYPRAVVRLSALSGAALSPGTADFEYGAVFRLDAISGGRSVDDGNNLLQRGLYADPAQIKLQVDRGYPSCLVRGSAGQAHVVSGTKVAPDAWYRVTCSRVGNRLAVQVARYTSTATPASKSVTKSAGSVTFKSSVLASLGGKLSSSGAVVSSSTDQFNGAVATAWVRRR